jgi:hypothetical protein
MSVTRWNGTRDVAVGPYDLSVRGSDLGLARLVRSLARVGGWFTDVYGLTTARGSAHFRVWLPEGTEYAVAEECKAEHARAPACIALNDCRDRFLICAVCTKNYNARLTDDERSGEGRLAVHDPASAPDVCSQFCAGRLVGRSDPRQ